MGSLPWSTTWPWSWLSLPATGRERSSPGTLWLYRALAAFELNVVRSITQRLGVDENYREM